MDKGKILVMDDEELVRNVLARMLEFLGYRAVAAKDGAEAIGLYRQHREEGAAFDAVILDLSVPMGMGGKEAMAELLRLDPEVKGIVSSGYADSHGLGDYNKLGFTASIAKPYELKALDETLQEILK